MRLKIFIVGVLVFMSFLFSFLFSSAYAIAIYNKIDGLTLYVYTHLENRRGSGCSPEGKVSPGGKCVTASGQSLTDHKVGCAYGYTEGGGYSFYTLCSPSKYLTGHRFLVVTGKYDKKTKTVSDVECTVWSHDSRKSWKQPSPPSFSGCQNYKR